MSDTNKSKEIPRRQMGCLKIANKSYPIYEGINVIGRDLKATVKVSDQIFSKQHAIISIVDDVTHLISDFGSSNGTKLGCSELIPHKFYKINDREPIIFGNVVGVYYLSTDSCLKTENDANETKSQIIDNIAPTQLMTQNIHDQPTQLFDLPQKVHNDTTQMIHEADTQKIHDVETQLLPGCSRSTLTTLDDDKITTDLKSEVEVDLDLSKSQLYDDVFANESFRLSLQTNCVSKYDIVVDETLPTDTKLDKSITNENNVSCLDDDDIILSTQDNAMIDRQALELFQKTLKSETSKESKILDENESNKKQIDKSVTENNQDDDSETDIEDEEIFIKNFQQKSTQLNNSTDKVSDDIITTGCKEENKQDNPNLETDIEDDLLAKHVVQEPTDSDSDTEIEDNILNNDSFNIRDNNKSIKDSGKDDDLLVTTNLVQNKNIEKPGDEQEDDLLKTPKRKDESNKKPNDDDDDDIDLLAPTQLLENKINENNKQIDENDDDLLAPTQLLKSKNKIQEPDDNDDDDDIDLLAPTQLLENKINENNKQIDENDDDLLAPTQLLKSKNKIQEPDDNDDDDIDLLAPTQLLENKINENNKQIDENDDDLLAPTQLLQSKGPRNKKQEDDNIDEMPTQLLEQNKTNDSIFSAPTQKLDTNKHNISSPRKKLSILSTKSSNNNVEEVDSDDDLAPTQLLEENKQNDSIFSAPTQRLQTKKPNVSASRKKSSIISTKSSNNDIKEVESDEDLAPTQLLEENKPKDSIFSAPTQKLEINKSNISASLKKSSIISIKSSNNDIQEVDDDDDLAPTQLLEKNKPNNSIFSATTQRLEINKPNISASQKKSSIISIKSSNNDTQEVEDDDDLAPTQLLDSENNKNKVIVVDEDNLAPTQILEQNDSISSAPTQILEKDGPNIVSSPKRSSILSTKSPKDKEKKSVNFSENIHDMPTPKLVRSSEQNKKAELQDNIFNAPTQLLENNVQENPKQNKSSEGKNIRNKLNKSLQDPNDSDNNSEINNTQESFKLVLSETDDDSLCEPTKKQNTSQSRLSGVDNSKTSHKEIAEPETQLEVDFCMETQKLYVEERTSRPDNPLAHMFAEEPTQMTENIIDDEAENNASKDEKPADIETSRRLEIRLQNIKDVSEASGSKSSTTNEDDFKKETFKRGRKKVDIETSRHLEVKLQNMKNITEDTGSKSNSCTTDEHDFKEETSKRGRKKKVKEDAVAQKAPKLNVTRVKNTDDKKINKALKESTDTKEEKKDKASDHEQQNDSLVKSSETDEDNNSRNTRGKRISYQQLNSGKQEKEKTTKGRPPKSSNVDKSEKEEEVIETKRPGRISDTKQEKKDKTSDHEQQNDSLVKSSETDEDNNSRNTRGKSISYQQLNSGKQEKKKTRGRPPKNSTVDKSETEEEVIETKKSARVSVRRLTRDTLKAPQKETVKEVKTNENSSDMDDFIVRRTRTSKRTHSVAETPKKKQDKEEIVEIEDSDDDSVSSLPTNIKKKVSKLQYTDDSEITTSNNSANSAVVQKPKSSKRSMKIEDYSSDENVNNNITSASICLNTPNTKRRKYEPLNVTISSTQLLNSSGETLKHKVVFTMLNDTTLEKSVKKLGGSIIDSVQACTVLVTNKISRSLKFLLAVALGKPIVQSKWIYESIKHNTFQDPWQYLLEDSESEKKFNFKLNESLNKSVEKKLLADTLVLIATKKNYDVLKDVIEASGGKCIPRVPAKNGKAIVVSYAEEKGKYSKYLKQKSLTVVSAEAIFSGVLQQELNLKQHLLS